MVFGVFGVASALASEPWWAVSSSATPTNLPPGGTGTVVAQLSNVGDESVQAAAAPVTIVDRLPEGLTATHAVGRGRFRYEFTCTVIASREVQCLDELAAALPPYEALEVEITVAVEAGGGGQNEVSVSGGGAGPATNTADLTVGAAAAPFSISQFGIVPENEGGSIDDQAGSHPFQLRTRFAFANVLEDDHYCELCGFPMPSALPREVSTNLPPGLLGNPTVVSQCTAQQFSEFGYQDANYCPADTAVGVASATINLPTPLNVIRASVPVFNLEPAPGEPARFGFVAEGVPVVLDAKVRTGGDYGVTITAHNLSQAAGILSTEVTFWGVPADPRHNNARGWNCVDGENYAQGPCEEPVVAHPASFLSLPDDCAAPLKASLAADTWSTPSVQAEERSFTFENSSGQPQALTGCENVPFQAGITATPETQATSTASGLTVDVHVPQQTSSGTATLAEAQIKETTVTLPEGLVVNPAAATGLTACSPGQIALESPGPGSCPETSKIGTVEIHTPLLNEVVGGEVFLAAQDENPFGSLLAVYIVANDPKAGVVVKIPVHITTDPRSGKLTAVVQNAPQLPFEDLALHLFGGERAVLATPTHCATYDTTASFTPWTEGPPVEANDAFQTTTGPGGGACPGTLPFNPSFTAGTTGSQAGAYSPFTLTFARQDSEQTLNNIEQTLPPGLLAKLAGVPLCGEAQANEGSCPQASQIGTVTVAAGVGSEPLYVNGTIYLTGPYNNGPFGIAVEVPAIAGPFNLDENGRPVVVRGSIRINPTTAQATVVSNAFPTILQGIPLQVRTVNVTLNRAGFTFNPTSCAAQKLTAAISSTEGANAGVSSPFGAVNCATLPFKPTFTASTAGRASKEYGASLVVKIASKGGPGTSGEEANIRSVKVDLPSKLPSRLSTLQKACLAATFEANPAACPKESNVGTATAKTPVLANPLTGPAYLVSHGGEAFPDLEIVLQGEGVKLVLDGNTLIKKGITSSTFKTVPDAPISSFELKLPTGKYSILTTNLPQSVHYNLCGQTLNMPTAITGQNGAEIHDTTKIGVSGCAKKKKASKKKPKKKAKKR
jgi:hypothetical protein